MTIVPALPWRCRDSAHVDGLDACTTPGLTPAAVAPAPALRRGTGADAHFWIPPGRRAPPGAAPGAEGAPLGSARGCEWCAPGRPLVIKPGQAAGIVNRDPGWPGGPEFAALAEEELEQRAKEAVASGIDELSDAQELRWASDRYAVLVVLQAMDAAGKDSAIEHVMSGVNPQRVQVFSFKKPSSEELDHHFLWRTSKALPERGRIGIFDRCPHLPARAGSTDRPARAAVGQQPVDGDDVQRQDRQRQARIRQRLRVELR